MSTCFICCSTPKHARVHVFFTNKSTKEIPTRRHGAHRSPFSSTLNVSSVSTSPFFYSVWVLLFQCVFFLIFQLHRDTEGKFHFGCGKIWKTDESNNMTASRPSYLKYKWTMVTRKEKTGDTPSPTLSLLRIICINKFRRKRIQHARSISQFQLCRAVSFRVTPLTPFLQRHPCRSGI